MTFRDFWTNENNPSLPKSEYLYNLRHIIVLIITAVLAITLSIIFRKKSERTKNTLFYILGSVFVFFETSTRIINLIIAKSYSLLSVLEIILPMHICSVMVWCLIFAIFLKKQFLINYSVIGGFIATLAFLLYPAVGLNKVYMTFTCIYSTVSHSIGFVTSILLMTLGKAKFEFKNIWQSYLCLIIMFIWGAILNFIIFPGADYMYMINDPLELNLSFPYQYLYSALLIAYTSIFYIIYTIIQKCKRKTKTESKE